MPAPAWINLEILPNSRLTDGKVDCAKVRVPDVKTDSIRTFRGGDKLWLTLYFALPEKVPPQKLTLECVDSALKPVWVESVNLGNDSTSATRTGGSIVVVNCRIPLDLPEGFFAFSIAVHDAAARSDLDLEQLGRAGRVHLQLAQFLAIHVSASSFQKAKGAPAVEWRVRRRAATKKPASGPQSEAAIAQAPHSEAALQGVGPPGDRLAKTGYRRSHENRSQENAWPTTIHITHQKAGSQWVYNILRDVAPGRLAEPKVENSNFMRWPIQADCVYPTVYVTREEFESVDVPKDSNVFYVIRDLRDTLVSLYFSWLHSHPIVIHPDIAAWRLELQSLPLEEGLLRLLERGLRPAAIQESWLDSGIKTFKYEDMVQDDVAAFADIVINHCHLPVSRAGLEDIVARHRFQQLTGGRERGQENLASHYRKGVAGDWRNFFTPRVKDSFKSKYGRLLIETGYESDLNW